MVNSEFIEDKAVVFLALSHQVFELFLACRFLLFQVLDDVAVIALFGSVLDD
jgi:hypothetical protein